MENKKDNNLGKIILLLAPPIASGLHLHSKENVWFFSTQKLKKTLLQKKDYCLEKRCNEALYNLISSSDYEKEANKTIIQQLLLEEKLTNSILFNYPLNSNQIESLEAELSEINRKINFIIIVSTSNYDLIKKIRSNYLTCPICERLFKKEEMKDNEKFVCPEDNEFQFLKEEIQKFHEFAIENHLVNSKKTIEKLLKENKITTSNIINLTVDNEKDIFSGEIQEKILKVIMNL